MKAPGPPGNTLTPKTLVHIRTLFPNEIEKVSQLLISECGNNLPFLQDADAIELERYRFAALRFSHGRITGLRNAIDLAKTDWRDLLVMAGFADDTGAHHYWDSNKK